MENTLSNEAEFALQQESINKLSSILAHQLLINKKATAAGVVRYLEEKGLDRDTYSKILPNIISFVGDSPVSNDMDLEKVRTIVNEKGAEIRRQWAQKRITLANSKRDALGYLLLGENGPKFGKETVPSVIKANKEQFDELQNKLDAEYAQLGVNTGAEIYAQLYAELEANIQTKQIIAQFTKSSLNPYNIKNSLRIPLGIFLIIIFIIFWTFLSSVLQNTFNIKGDNVGTIGLGGSIIFFGMIVEALEFLSKKELLGQALTVITILGFAGLGWYFAGFLGAILVIIAFLLYKVATKN